MPRWFNTLFWVAFSLVVSAAALLGFSQIVLTWGQASEPDASLRAFPLDTLETSEIRVGETVVPVYVMLSTAQVAEGMMFLADEDFPDDWGMLFVFREEQVRPFWMRNTFIPLDIAYLASDGRVVNAGQMEPLTIMGNPSSIEPCRMALEMKQGSFARLGLNVGDVIEVPEDLLTAAVRGVTLAEVIDEAAEADTDADANTDTDTGAESDAQSITNPQSGEAPS